MSRRIPDSRPDPAAQPWGPAPTRQASSVAWALSLPHWQSVFQSAVMADKDVRDRLKKLGLDPWTDKPENFEEREPDIRRAGIAINE